MSQMKRLGIIITITLAVVIINAILPFAATLSRQETSTHSFMAQDTAGPTISGWNVSASAYRAEPFDVWAVVTDDDSGVQNVSLQVRNSVSTINWYLMPFNGSHYIESVPALPINESYTLRVFAFDMANNSRNSYVRNIDLRISGPLIDPNITMPVVVGSSIGLFALVIVLTYFYDKRQSAIVPESAPQVQEDDKTAENV